MKNPCCDSRSNFISSDAAHLEITKCPRYHKHQLLYITNVMIVQCSMSLGSECDLGLKWERPGTLCGVLAVHVNNLVTNPELRHLSPPFLVLLIYDSGDKKTL